MKDKVKDILSLSFITDNIWVRLALIVLPFVFSLIIGGSVKGGDKMKIRDSNLYDVYYNTTTQEYFVEIDSGSVNLALYVPNGTQQINVYFKETCAKTGTGIVVSHSHETKNGSTIKLNEETVFLLVFIVNHLHLIKDIY